MSLTARLASCRALAVAGPASAWRSIGLPAPLLQVAPGYRHRRGVGRTSVIVIVGALAAWIGARRASGGSWIPAGARRAARGR